MRYTPPLAVTVQLSVDRHAFGPTVDAVLQQGIGKDVPLFAADIKVYVVVSVHIQAIAVLVLGGGREDTALIHELAVACPILVQIAILIPAGLKLGRFGSVEPVGYDPARPLLCTVSTSTTPSSPSSRSSSSMRSWSCCGSRACWPSIAGGWKSIVSPTRPDGCSLTGPARPAAG